uniref:AAA+ ATPase domain-containing protein n=1 Tax=viral metagenome TaxID=1070528 RepID=A0A6C0HXU6_9ZZZZ
MTSNFSEDQKYAFEQFKLGKNMFITGPGGTGKTFLIKQMVQNMIFTGKKYQVCAMTGCAAVLLQTGARTLHSWSGIGLANGQISSIIQKIVRNKKLTKQWRETNVLIVDEVSMMSKKVFELIELIARQIKNRSLPFGGMQVIFTGDFFQLPPVGNYDEEDTQMFCFQSPKWSTIFLEENHVELSTIFRQQNDEIYKRILNQVRIGELDEEGIKILQECVGRKLPANTENMPTKIYAIRAKTDFVNANMYNKIKNSEYKYDFEVKTNLTTYLENGKTIETHVLESCRNVASDILDNEANNLMNSSNRQRVLSLKEGAKVICLHNIDLTRDICNGSQGVVTKFVGESNMPVVKFQNGVEITMEPIWIQSEDLPCVAVAQIPLCLAWALTIHKIQGATLGAAEMDLGNSVFEYGQTYVALSRIQSLNGLYLSAFEPGKIKANPIVKDFYNCIKKYKRPKSISIQIPTIDCSSDNIFSKYEFVNRKLEEEEIENSTIKKIKFCK